jgi:hypothetical protein
MPFDLEPSSGWGGVFLDAVTGIGEAGDEEAPCASCCDSFRS